MSTAEWILNSYLKKKLCITNYYLRNVLKFKKTISKIKTQSPKRYHNIRPEVNIYEKRKKKTSVQSNHLNIMLVSSPFLKFRWWRRGPNHLITHYIHLILFGILFEPFAKNLFMPIKQTLPIMAKACEWKQIHDMTNNHELLTVLYTAETVGAKSRSSRGCCTGPLGILEERVKDKRTQKWIAWAVRKRKLPRQNSGSDPSFVPHLVGLYTYFSTETGKNVFQIS